MSRIVLLLGLVVLSLTSADAGAQSVEKPHERLKDLHVGGRIGSAIGVTRSQTPIVCLFENDNLDLKTPKTRILFVGGLDGSSESVDATMAALKWFHGRNAWLERDKYEPAIRRAWDAIRTRIDADGGLVDVCTGTGKQKDLRAYLDRMAILGRDARGGAMALLAAVELAEWESERRGGP